RRRRGALAAEVGDGLGEVADGHGLDAGEGDLGAALGRTDEPAGTVPARTLVRPARAGHGPPAPVERELADGGVPGERARWQLARSCEHGEGDRQIETRALLAQVGRSEVDGDPALRPLELRRGDSRSDTLLRLLAG